MTLNSVIALSLRYFTEFDSYYVIWVEDRLIMSAVYRLRLLAKTDPPFSAVSLRQLSYLWNMTSASVIVFATNVFRKL